MGLQTDQPSQEKGESEGQHDMATAILLHSADMRGGQLSNRQYRRLSEDIASTSEPSGRPAAAVSLSEISFYHDGPVSSFLSPAAVAQD